MTAEIQNNTIFFIGILSILFNIYLYFRNPQIKTDQVTADLKNEIANLKGEIKDIKETDLRSLKIEINKLTDSNNELSKTVVKLATIIDERIPKGSPMLTPAGS